MTFQFCRLRINFIRMLRYTNSLVNNITYKCKYINELGIMNSPNKFYITTRYCQNQKVKCWKCGVEKKSVFELFCENCNVIQQPNTKDNYFQVLGINETYDVDLKSITNKYRQLQSVLHPDKYSNKSNEEKQISEEYSSIVNRAYNTIQSPINRGLHLLALKGEKIDENENKNADQAFLIEIMELNEEVEEADTPEEFLNLNRKNRKELENIVLELSKAFNSGDIIKAKQILIRMKYYTSISTQINNILRERGIIE